MVLDFDRLCVPLRDVISSTEFWVEIIGVARIFDGGGKPQITCNDVIRNFQKRNFMWDQNIVE